MENNKITNETTALIKLAKSNVNKLLSLSNKKICDILLEVASSIMENESDILSANTKDLVYFQNIYSDKHPNYDRLLLNESRIAQIIEEINGIVSYNFNSDDNILSQYEKNELDIKKLSVPLGCVGVIYESRPNVTIDIFSLCFRSQNTCVLKGGKEAENTNRAFVGIIKNILQKYNLENIIQLLDSSRESIPYMLNAKGLLDVLIPRGGKELINFIRDNAKVPVIETGAGAVHLYFDKYGDIEIASNVIFNSKTRRVSVCNALDCILIHHDRIGDLHSIVKKMEEKNVIIYANNDCYDELKGKYKFLEKVDNDFNGIEFLDYKILVKSVNSIDDAIQYISQFTSNHSECIITNDTDNAEKFCSLIDASTVYVNTSTAFTDGAQFGLGAEIGVSTQKLHARGPMGVDQLRTIKYKIESNGKCR